MNKLELTPYSVWSANPDNKYNDPVESWSNYFENQREEFTAVGKYDEEVEQGIQSTLASVLVGEGILNEDNSEEIQKQLVGIQNKNSLGGDLKFLSDNFDPEAMEMSEERFADINDFNNAVFDSQIPEGFSVDDLDDITKEVKKARKNFVTNLYGTGQIDAGVYFDEEGNRIFVGGRLKDGDTFENIVANSKKYGVKASDFLALKKLQEPAGGVYGDIPKHELAEGNAALQEINAIINEGAGRDFLDLRGKMTGLALAKRKKDEYGFWANTVHSGQDLLGDALRNARLVFNLVTFDEDEEELLRAQKLFENQQDIAEEKSEMVRKQVIAELSKITQRSGPVFEQAVESYIEKINADGIQDSSFGYNGREFDEDDLASNIRRTKYYGVLVHNALNVKPEEFRTALSEFGLSDQDIEVEDVKRVANLESNFSSTDEVLAETMGDDWQSAKAEGKQQGLDNHEILENFIRDNDVSVKWRGFGMSAWHSVTGLFYGAGALLDTDWGRDGIVENAKQINLNRELANIYGVEMGFAQDLSEALAPMVADMVVTAGAVGLSGVTFGGSLSVAGGYFAAKSAGGAAARNILGRAVVARTLIGNTMKNTLTGGLGKYSLSQRVYRNAATGELKEETLAAVATRIKKAGVLKGLKQGELIGAIKSYNSQLAKHVGVKAVGTFIPAAVRSGGATYGSVFSSLEKELTAKYFKDGAWADDWNEDRVKQEAHSTAYGTALMGGTVTGLITASFGSLFGGKFGGVESAFLKGMSFKQLKTVTDRLSGSVSSVEGLKSLMAQSITKTFKQYGSSKGLAFAAAVGGEGAEEAIDTIINQMVEDAWQNKESPMSETLSQAWHAFKLGAVLGGTASVGGALVRKVPVLGNAVTDRRALASLESSVMADFDERVAEATKANPELAKQRAQLKALAPQTAEAAQKVLKKLNAEAKQKAEAKKQGETPAPEPSESEAPAVSPEEGPQPEFVITLAGYAKNKKPQISSDLTDRANIILNAAIDKERAAGTWDTKSAAEVNKYIEEESIISLEQAKKDVAQEAAKLKEKISANPDTDKTFENQESPEEKQESMIGNSRWTSESRKAVNEQGGVDPETGDAEANSAPVGQHQYKTPEQKYNNAMLSLKLARGKWQQAVAQATQLPKDSEAREKAEQAIEDGLNSGELIDPRRYDALSKAARSLKVEDDIADEEITEHDEAQLEDLVNGGFPVSIIQEHLQALGLTLDKTGDDNFKALSKRLSNLIEEKYPVFKKNVTSKDKLPDLFSADQKYVYLDEEGNGIFNNDPQQMMTFLKSHILIPVSEEVYEASTIAGSEVNPSFVIEKPEGSNQAYVVDILVPVRGGLVSAWADFRNIRKNNFNYSRVKGLLQDVEQLQETTPEDRLDIKVKNPFPSVEGTGSDPNITLRELLALAEDFKTLKQFIEAGDPPTGPDKKRIMVGSAQSRSRYYTAAAMSLGLSIKKKVYETAQQNPSNDNATQAPFNMAKLRDFSLGYFQDMARSRKEQQVLNLGNLVKQGERIDKNPNFDADRNASAGSGVAETPTPLPVLPKTGTGRYLRSNLATIATALEKDQELRGDLIVFIDENVSGQDSSAKNKSASALVDLLLQHLVKGNNVASDSTLEFLTSVNKISETNPEAYNMIVALQAIGLSSPSLHPDVSTDADLLAFIKEEMVKAYGDVAQDISDSSVDEFFQLVSHHITTFRQNSIATEESDAVIEATNLQEIEDLGLVDGDVESVLEAIRLIKENGKPEFLRPLAKVILDNPEFVKTIVFKIESSDKGFSGEYDAETGQPIITINPRGATGESGIAGTLLHEYAHAFSVDFVAMPVELRTPEHNTRFAELEAHRAKARVKAEKINDEVFLNGTANVEEFIAYTLTSQEFRGFLGPSLLQKILRVVAKIVTFGRAKLPPTALQKSIANAMSSVRVGGALTQAGITNHVATRLFQTQTERAKIADAYGGKSSILAEARLEAKAEQFTEWVRDYLPPEIVMSTDETSSVVVKIDGETGVLVFNPKRAAVKLAQLVSDNEIDPDRQTHLLGALLNEEMGHAAANQILTDEQVLAVIQSMDDTDFIRIIKEYYPESEQAEAIARMRSEDAEVSSVEKYRLANEAFAAHASMAMRGMTTNEQIAFLQTNPSLLASFIQYLKAFLSKLTYHRTRKDLSPEMRDAVNNVVRELRAMELAYRPAPRSITYNTRNGEQIVDALVKQAVGYRMLAPDDSSDDDATLDLESRFGADVDLQYMAAIEDGDMETVQKMVDAAAEAAGYTDKGARAGVYRGGKFLLPESSGNLGAGFYAVLGGTAADVREFAGPITGEARLDKSLTKRVDNVAIDLGDKPIYLNDPSDIGGYLRSNNLVERFDAWLDYQETVNSAYKKIGSKRPDTLEARRSGMLRRPTTKELQEKEALYREEGFTERDIQQRLEFDRQISFSESGKGASFLFDQGLATSIIVDWSKNEFASRNYREVAVADATRFKSREPITRDKKEEIIPLSKRFDSRKENILDLESRFGADVLLAPVHKGQELIDDAMLHGTKNIDAGAKGSRPHMIGMKFFEMMDPKDRIHWDPKNQDKIDRMGGRLYGVLQRALNEYPDFVSWYEERVQMSVDIFEELDPDIKKPEDNFVFKTLLAVTSNGNKVAAQTEDSWAIYQNWKKTGKFAPAETKNPDTGNNWVRGTRTSAITNQLKLMDGLVSKYTWERMQKFLARSGTVKELKEALVSELDFTKQDASDLLKGELIDETVPFALIFGPKLGSFYHNLNGKFDSITMDLWFMRTFGRTAGTQMKVATPAQQRKTNKRFDDAVAAYLTKDPKGELFKLAKLGRKRKRSVEVVMALKNYYTSPANRSKYYDEKTKSWVTLKKGEKMEKISPLDNELRKATNQLEKIVDGHELVEAPQNGSHRRFMRLSMYNAMDKLEQNNGIKMIPAEAQAILWYYEKAVHTEFGSGKDEEAPDYATAANDVYRSITGSNAGSFTVSTANIRRRDLRGSVGEDSRSSRERRRNLDLESRFGADAKIPDFLNEVDMQEVEIGQWLELLDVPLMELHEYDIKAKDGTFGTKFKRFWIRTFQRRADKRVVRFFNQTNAFIRETKSIVEIYQKKHDRLLAQEEERLGQPIPPSLIAHASGSTNGSQLTFAQEEEVDSAHASDLAKAMKIMDQADRKAAIDAAAKAKASKIMLFRNKNRAAELNVRNNALKNLLTVSPKMYALIVEMRQLQDQLSKKGVDVFEGSMDAADLNLAFNFDRGIYITRRYRMFEDNDFAAKVLEDDVYEETRDKAVLYFAKQKALQDVDALMQKHGVGYNEARQMVEDDLVNNPEHHASVGRKMMRSFIKGYQHGEARRQLRIKQGSSTQDIVLQDSFNDKALNKIAQTINEKKNIPDPVRELLGEFGEEAGSTNLGHSILHTASMLANQSFFNKIKKLGLESADPWLVTKEQYDKDPEKYEDWSQLKADTGEEDLAPIKGMYFKGDIAEQFEDLFNDPKEMRDINNERVEFETRIGSIVRKATGYSLALKTLGSVGFYFRNMVGNAMYFGPMQGYWGGGKLLFDEAVGGLAAAGSVMGESDINSNQSLMVQAARGSLADLNWHLTELKSMDVFGDELEVTQIQNLLAGRATYADLEADLKKAGELHQQMANQINTQSKGAIPEGAADLLAKYGLDGWELTKTGAKRAKGASDALMQLGGRLASAADGFFKIGLYNFELDTLVEAAKQAPPSDPLSKMISGPNNTPSSGLKQMAAEIVKDTTQSYSRALPVIKTFTRSSMGVVIAPYIRFAADVPRVFINGIFQAKKEMASKNPVIRKRGKRRALGALTTTAASLALTKGSQILLFGFDDEDEMDMIRGGMPKWMRSSGICFYKTEDGEIYSTDLTFLNPFAAYQEPFVRGLEALLKGDIGGAVSKTLWVDGLLKPFASEQILAGAITDVVFNEDEYGRKLVQEGEDWGAFTLLGQVWKRAYEPRTFRAAKDSFDAIFSDKSEEWFTSPLGLIWKEVLPVKPHKLDVDKTFRRYLRNHMEDYRNNRMSLEKETMSPSDVTDEYNKFAKVRIYQANEFSKAVIGATKLGMNPAEISQNARSFGVSKQRLQLNQLDLIMRPVMSEPMKRRMMASSKLQLRYSDYLNALDKYDLYIPTGD